MTSLDCDPPMPPEFVERIADVTIRHEQRPTTEMIARGVDPVGILRNGLEKGSARATIHSMKKAKSSKALKVYSCPLPFTKVYQFKVTLLETDPPVWRRIQVPGCYSFWDLHCAITDAFGWLDYHLHLFTIKNPKTDEEDHFGIPDEDGDDEEMMGFKTLPSWMTKISRNFTKDRGQI